MAAAAFPCGAAPAPPVPAASTACASAKAAAVTPFSFPMSPAATLTPTTGTAPCGATAKVSPRTTTVRRASWRAATAAMAADRDGAERGVDEQSVNTAAMRKAPPNDCSA